jgi:GT2 family glycosyltransferase
LLGGALRLAGLVTAGIRRAARRPLTNACGDFTVMARADWFRLRGYPEWHVFSWHLDTVLVYQALSHGIRTQRLSPRAPVFHIDHSGGFAPESARALFSRLQARGVPFMTDEELHQLCLDTAGTPPARPAAQFNEAGWGMADLRLPEASPA